MRFVRKSIRKMVKIRVIMALGSILLFGFIVTYNMTKIKRTEVANEQSNALLERACAAEVAHYKWVNNLSNALYVGTEFTGSIDHTGCVLGQWLYGEAGTDDADILSLREKLEPLHRELHQSASYVLDLKKTDAAQAGQYHQQVITANLATLVGLLEEVVEREEQLNAEGAQYMTSLTRQTQVLSYIFSLLALASLLSLILYVIRQVVRPILVLTEKSAPLRDGQLALDLDHNADNELGVLAKTLDDSLELIHGYVEDINHIMKELSEGNFDVHVSAPFVGDFQSIERSIESFTSTLSAAISRISQAEYQVAKNAEQLSGDAQRLAQGATEQASAVEELYATLDELSKNAEKNVKAASSVQEDAHLMGEQVRLSSSQMEDMLAAMKDIISESQKIENIISTIENIAFRTNLLALNASVEAARAGAAGKGFAVVSGEVRNLAAQSDQAAKATRELIENSVQAAQKGGRILNEVFGSMQKTMELALQSGSEIGEIAKVVEGEAESIGQVVDGISQISAVVQSNSASSEESAAVSTELFDQVRLLQEETRKFRLKGSAHTDR